MKQIKIAHVITRMIIGGAQENTLLSVIGLKKMPRYQVDLITGPPLGPEGSLIEVAHAQGVHLAIIPELRRNINPYYDVIAFLKLLKIIKTEKYDIIHTHSSKAGILARLAAKLAGSKVIIHTIHGMPFHKYERRLLNLLYLLLERWMGRYSSKIVTVCPEMTRKAIAARLGKADQFISIYSGIETNTFTSVLPDQINALRQQLKIPENAYIVGKVARLFHLKGHRFLLPAAKQVISEIPNTYFILVGDGILREYLQREAQRLGIAKNVIFTGLVPPTAIPAYLTIMDVVVHLSLREGLPRVVPQAFLCKKPVIVYDIDGAHDIVEENENGFLIPPEDTTLLSKRIIHLLKHADLRRLMGHNGYNKAQALFPYETMVQSLNKLYMELVP